MNAKELYKDWKDSHKVNMCVYTDEQMFVMGYESRENEVQILVKQIEAFTELVKEFSVEEKPKKTKTKVKKDD